MWPSSPTAGLGTAVEQSNLSFNHRAGTVRGMHYQVAPHPEAKLVRCIAGAVVDIIVDMRPGSATRLQHVKVELSAANRRALYVPPYFAHGYQTLVDGTEVTYQVGGAYAPVAERGLRWDDPALGLDWPLPVSAISAKDATWPLLAERVPGCCRSWPAGRGARMIIVDRALERREAEGRPIRVALVGAGFMGRGVANQIINSTTGMRLVAIANRTLAQAERAYREAGVTRRARGRGRPRGRPGDHRRDSGRHDRLPRRGRGRPGGRGHRGDRSGRVRLPRHL